jgi:polyisoprenoid-binding protein YceI
MMHNHYSIWCGMFMRVQWTKTRREIKLRAVRLALFLFACAAPTVQAQEQVPVFVISRQDSTVKFYVKASIELRGTFDQWDATLTFASRDVRTGVLRVTVQAASVDTGSSIKNSTLKGADFFNVQQQPLIRFVSKAITQTGPDSFQVTGDFTIRGVTRREVLTLKVSGQGTGSGVISGTMAFDRKNYGMNSGIPFVTIANHVEVTVLLRAKRVAGPPLVFKQ